MEQITAQQLYVFTLETPSVYKNVERTFYTLSKHATLDRDKARALLLKNNVRQAAILYCQVHFSDKVAYHRHVPEHEREGCAALLLRYYEGWNWIAGGRNQPPPKLPPVLVENTSIVRGEDGLYPHQRAFIEDIQERGTGALFVPMGRRVPRCQCGGPCHKCLGKCACATCSHG
jgi:hypothetical protein